MTETEKGANPGQTESRTGLSADEKIGSLFQPDSLLAAQYFETMRRKTLFEPEKRLMLAILEDAISCFQSNLLAEDVRSSRLFLDAQEWIVDAHGDWIFSFENVCGYLGMNPAYMRQGLLRWMENRLAKERGKRPYPRKKMTA